MVKKGAQVSKSAFDIWIKKSSDVRRPMEIVGQLNLKYKENENKIYTPIISKYMRNQFSFYGIKSPERRQIDKEVMVQYGEGLKQPELYALMVLCWKQDKREFQMFAQDLFFKRIDEFLPRKDIYDPMELVKGLIVTKSWWDTVDMLASKVLGYLAKNDSSHSLPLIEEWISDENMWLRRSAILHQLSYKKSTDEQKLFRYCLQCCHEKEFFIQKAIGWSLREYAKSSPKAVKKFVKENEKKLANLSKREALKHIR